MSNQSIELKWLYKDIKITNMKSSRIISISGLDAPGKSTKAALLVERITKKKIKHQRGI